MSDPNALRAYLVSEVEGLEPYAFLAVTPSEHPLRAVEVAREDSGLEVRIPGRMPMMPELPADARSALRDRGFTSEDPADRTHPWVSSAPDAEKAVDRLREVLVDVFGEKPDAEVDIAHGSRKTEYEARKKLAAARERIAPVVASILGCPPKQDEDGDYVLPIEDVHVVVAPRAAMDGQIVVRVFAITNVGIDVTPELGLFLARLNFGLMFGRFALDTEHRSIWFDETLLGEAFREEELRFVVRMVASTADAWDDRLKQMFGGATHQEVLAGRTAEPCPTAKPGEGVGHYL